MKLIALLFFLFTCAPTLAAPTGPSQASIRELLTLTDSRKLIDNSMGQIDSMMQTSMQQALAGQTITPEQQKILDEMRTKSVALINSEMSWETLEPIFVDIYEKSFTQGEIDGMLQFYKSEAGKAVIAKLPLVMQHSMQAMQSRMTAMMPKLQRLQQESIETLKATEKKQPNAR